ncbi:MAG: hypothetical protein LBG19_05365 [Prevotellaceae bacterium]|jgi:hypothetical protein|nr:hypothetical protein [Prevotellaceae bacterium]
MISSTAFGQISDLLQAAKQAKPASYSGQLVAHTFNGEDNNKVKDIYILLCGEGMAACKLASEEGENAEYWMFKVGTLCYENEYLTGELSNISFDEVNGLETISIKIDGLTKLYSKNFANDITLAYIRFFLKNKPHRYTVIHSISTLYMHLCGFLYSYFSHDDCEIL